MLILAPKLSAHSCILSDHGCMRFRPNWAKPDGVVCNTALWTIGNRSSPESQKKSLRGSPLRLMNLKTWKRQQSRFGIEDSTTALRISSVCPERVARKSEIAPIVATRAARPRRSQSASKSEKLLCRYCGSDDLASSFRKRRDARRRSCFKKRYGSPAGSEKATHRRKPKPAK